MNAIVERHREGLERVCQSHSVRRLELFGSATGPSFNSASSDLDFLVEFKALEPGMLAKAYLGLLVDLADLFHRPVDLVMPRAVRNPYFLERINENRVLLYAA